MFQDLGFPGLGLGLIDAVVALYEPMRFWVFWLVLLNLVVPVVFIDRLEAKLVIFVFVLSAATMGQLFEVYGFSKILGLAHLIFWPPLLLWLSQRWWGIDEGAMRLWVAALFLTNAASLLIDAWDVGRYFLMS
jgi:hypothetical protein